jgi:hypothetical protein
LENIMTGKATFLALIIVGLLVCPATADSFSVTAPSSPMWALPGGTVTVPISINGTGLFEAVDLGLSLTGTVLQLSDSDITKGALVSSGSWYLSPNTATNPAQVVLYAEYPQLGILDPSGTLLNATFHVISSTATIGSSSTIGLVNNFGSPFTMSGGPTINVIAAPEWKDNLSGTWSNASYWKGPVVNAAGAWAILGTAVNTGIRTVTLNEPVTLGKLDISPSSGGSYTVLGSSANKLVMTHSTGSAMIVVTSGQNTINAPLSFTNSLGVTVSGSAQQLSVSAAVTGTGSLTKDGLGLLALGNTLSMTGAGSVWVKGGSLTATTIVGANTSLSVSGNSTLAARYIDVDEIVVKPGSMMILGNPNGVLAPASGAVTAPAGVARAVASAASVPEPGTMVLLTMAAFCLPLLYRFKRRGK